MKKILFLITQSEMGGAQRFLLTFLKHLDRTKFLASVAAGEGSELPIPVTILPSLKRKISFVSDLKAFYEIRSLLRKEKPDVLFLLSSKAGFLGSLAGRLEKVPRIIYRIGGFAFHEDIGRLKRWLYFLAEKASKSCKDHLIVNNRKDEESALQMGYRRENVSLIHNGLEEAFTGFSREIAREALHIQKDVLAVVCIANWYPNKGLMDLLEAVQLLQKKSLPEFRLYLIGDGLEREKLHHFCKHHQLSQIHFLGKIPDAARYLKAFDLFILPSRKEGMPWSILEAYQAEVPVLATAVGGVPELMTHEQEGFVVPPKDPEALAKALETLLNDQLLRKTFAEHGKTRLSRSFRLTSMVKSYKDLLIQV